MDPLFLEFESLLLKLAHSQASDLFLGEGRVPSCRLDGEIQTLTGPASSREFIDVALRTVLRPEQYDLFTKEGDIDAGFTHPVAGRFRLNAHLHRRRPAIVLRKVPSGALSFEELSLPESLKHFAQLRHGLILVAGATGSGKSTTLAAMVHHINANFTRHIVTIEDPVEFVHEDLRIIDVFPSYQQNQVRAQLASALLAVVSQRLIPAKEEGSRAAAFEILLASSAVRTLIRESKTHQMVAAIEMGLREGMQTLDRSLESLVREGRITMEEASRHMRNADWSRQHPAESPAQEEHSTVG